jgi:hypothetical protein
MIIAQKPPLQPPPRSKDGGFIGSGTAVCRIFGRKTPIFGKNEASAAIGRQFSTELLTMAQISGCAPE